MKGSINHSRVKFERLVEDLAENTGFFGYEREEDILILQIRMRFGRVLRVSRKVEDIKR